MSTTTNNTTSASDANNLKALFDILTNAENDLIESYYRFTAGWLNLYPKPDDNNYVHGMNIIRSNAKDFGFTPSQIYSILATCQVIHRNTYLKYKTLANKHGNTLNWTQLRMLGNGRLTEAQRNKFFNEISTVGYSVRQTRRLVDKLLGVTRESVVKNSQALHWSHKPPGKDEEGRYFVVRLNDQTSVGIFRGGHIGTHSVMQLTGNNAMFYGPIPD
jgi:hypothetical protein